MEDEKLDMFGLKEGEYERLSKIVGSRLTGKRKTDATMPFLKELEAEDRPLQDKLIMAMMLGCVLR